MVLETKGNDEMKATVEVEDLIVHVTIGGERVRLTPASGEIFHFGERDKPAKRENVTKYKRRN